MSMEEDLARLVKAAVKAEVENQMRTRTSEFIGRGGDITLGGMGNVWIQPGVNKKAYYNGTEILTGISGGTGITGSGTANYLPKFTSASVIGNSTLSDDGTTLTSTAQNMVLNAAAPGYILQSGGNDKSYFYFSTNTILRSIDTDLILRAQDSTKNILHRIGTVDKLTINATQIISTAHLYTNAKSMYIFDGDPNGAGIARLSLTYLGNDGRVIGTNGYLRLAGASGIIAEDAIAMSGNKITGLAAGTANGDALRYEQLPDLSTYLPLSAGISKALTGHLYTNAKSMYIFDGDPNGAGIARLSLTYLGNDGRVIGTNGNLLLEASGDIYADSTTILYLRALAANGIVRCVTGGLTRLSISDTIVPTVPINMNNQTLYNIGGASSATTSGLDLAGGKSIRFNGAGNLDLYGYRGIRTTSGSDGILRLYSANFADGAARDRITIGKSASSANNDAPIKLVDSILYFQGLGYTGTGCYIKNDINGTMEVHIPTGQAFKIVVG